MESYKKRIYLIFILMLIIMFIFLTYDTDSLNRELLKIHSVNNDVDIYNLSDDDYIDELPFDYELVINYSVKSEIEKLRYILTWTGRGIPPISYLSEGQKVFKDAKCDFSNCYLTFNKSLLKDVTMYDAILFHAQEYAYLNQWTKYGIPKKRSPDQKYVMATIESSHYYPICNPVHNNFFNWTWTSRLDSDVLWNYFGVTDIKTGKFIGPRIDMTWKKDMEDLSIEEKKRLSGRTKAVAWLVSNCHSRSNRENYVKRLVESLKKYNLTVDIYGLCGSLKWKSTQRAFFSAMKKIYYFYLAFENSFAEDYVTEKLANALQFGIVPIVWGLGNYTRFAPPGSYIDATKFMFTDDLADKINHLMNNVDEYAKYFRWKKYYVYYRDFDSKEVNGLCNLCKALNDPIKMAEHKCYSDIKKWWNGAYKYFC